MTQTLAGPWRLDPELHAWRTDPRVVRAALGLLPVGFVPRTMLDPGAGEGPWGREAKVFWPDMHLTGVERQACATAESYDAWHCDDLLTWVAPHRYDFIAGNPPFGDIGFPIIVRARTEWLAPGGYALFYYHQRLLASLDRYRFFRHHAPIAVQHVVPRPKHTDEARTERQGEYIVALWRQGGHGHNGTGEYRGGWLYWREQELDDDEQLALPLFATL
jgi:hypothetical protein